jgi:hypothetical protein
MPKNMIKYEAYQYSFRRMDSALKARFFLEAVMIAESILSDRLLSVLAKNNLLSEKEMKSFSSFSFLVKKSRELPVPFERLAELDGWRVKRNKVAHAIAKSSPGEPTITTAAFRELAEDAAKQGRNLCDALKKWSRQKQSR